jgi:hypothetical protein
VTAAAHLAEFEAGGPASIRAHLTEEHRATTVMFRLSVALEDEISDADLHRRIHAVADDPTEAPA